MRLLRPVVLLVLGLSAACGGESSSSTGDTSSAGGSSNAGAAGSSSGSTGGGTAGAGGAAAQAGTSSGGAGGCKSSSECAAPAGPCVTCGVGMPACPTAACVAGACVVSPAACPKGPCAVQDAQGVGACDKAIGWAWNGSACVLVGGCSCQGADCAALASTPEACATAHDACIAADPCAGKKCGDPCTTCAPGAPCPPVEQACDSLGQCGTGQPVCAGSCKPEDAKAVGDCFLALGYAWNGSTCAMLGGCTCEGVDCKSLAQTIGECFAKHAFCACQGKTCGEACPCLAETCDASIHHCDSVGVCHADQVSCPKAP